MAEIGEIIRGREIGKVNNGYYIWSACVDCGKERWVFRIRGLPERERCGKCGCILNALSHSLDKSHMWKGGRVVDGLGYVLIKLQRDDFFYLTAEKRGYILEHRLVMAKYLGRNLQSWEIVHHKNGMKHDNRIDNLELVARTEHMREHTKGYKDGYRQGYQDAHNAKITELLGHIKLLEWQVRELEKGSVRENG